MRPVKAANGFPDAFRTEWINVKKGIRVGHLEPEQRLTQILKARLLNIFSEDFLVDHWGRGLYWTYIWFCPRSNLKAKNFHGPGQFPSAKFFVGVDVEEEKFVSGLYVESGYNHSDEPRYMRGPDWDWNRFLDRLRHDGAFRNELERLVLKEAFAITIGFLDETRTFEKESYEGIQPVLGEIENRMREDWVVVQIYYPFTEKELKAMDGRQIVDAVMGTWHELLPAANGCLQMPLDVSRQDGR